MRAEGLRRRARLLVAIGGVIAAALASVVWIQARQFQLLNEAGQYQDDHLQVGLGQLQAEYLRLQLQWREALSQGRIDEEALQLRYDIFVSRVTLLDTDRARRTVLAQGERGQVREALDHFIDTADAWLGPRPERPLDAAALAALYPALQALGPPIQTLVLEGAHDLAAQAAQRNAAVRASNRNTLALTVLLALCAFGFAVLALTQFRRLELRRRALETLTGDLREARRVAEAASAAKSTFLANMSHEIRTPLQGVLGMLALLAASPLDAQQRARLRTARGSADHLLAILNDILDLAKLEAGKMPTSPQAVDLHALLADVDTLMRAQAEAKGLALSLEIEPGLPRWVELDPTRVRQILLNLASNAVKFTQQGRVTLQAVRTADGQLAVHVQDTGIGIDAATLEQLFRRFGRGDESRARRHGGTGLGLEISRQLARLMGGDIAVRSEAGQGSCFTLSLPLREQPAPAAEPRPRAVAAPGRTRRSSRVLVADDNAVNREFTGAVLEHLGYQVVFAHDGAEAVSAVRDHAVDLVLMDLHMPGTDGLAATHAIRHLDGPRARVPVIALTADAFADTRAACLAAGMDGFAAKPVSPEELGALMLQHLGAPEAGAADRAGAAAGTLVDTTILHDVCHLLPLDRLETLADRFVAEARDSVERMREALGLGDHETIGRCAHACKGMAAALGLRAVADAAARLQQAAMAADTADPATACAPTLAELEALITPSREALRASVTAWARG